ncbi:hypothetical protein [Paenibacillus sediminis]|uniref:General stress protein 17M-like domain-containing protein n=1 Tax=Paenibacillus sediminis TaxID=664909 RepID=A0ABS4GYN8_9BACL|nr:hypothetical protein [Paenibacillus sediminis]
MAEKNILAYFKSPEEAEGVARKLRALRVDDLSIDRFSRYPSTSYADQFSPLTGQLGSLTTLTQDAGLTSTFPGILAAADPTASGMSDGGQGGPTGRNILLTVVLDESVHEQAMRLIEEAGGFI